MYVNFLCLFPGAPKEALKTGLSDMDYLRSKVVTKSEIEDEADDEDENTKEMVKEEEGSGDEDDNDDGDDEENDHTFVRQNDSAYESGEMDSDKKDLRLQVGVIVCMPLV